jgi:hypothetical protein
LTLYSFNISPKKLRDFFQLVTAAAGLGDGLCGRSIRDNKLKEPLIPTQEKEKRR